MIHYLAPHYENAIGGIRNGKKELHPDIRFRY